MIREIFVKNGLSKREAEVAELVATGLSNKEVANRLFVTEKTIKFHLTNIYKKMKLTSRTQLIVWSLPHMGFIEAAQPAPLRQDLRQGQAAGGELYRTQNSVLGSGVANNGMFAGNETQTSQNLIDNNTDQEQIPSGINPVSKVSAS